MNMKLTARLIPQYTAVFCGDL